MERNPNIFIYSRSEILKFAALIEYNIIELILPVIEKFLQE